jgi:acyl-CoA reductase-like NAD-dependent aldehyde dehydrogenase
LERCGEVVLQGRRAGGELSDGYFLSPTLVVERAGADASSAEEIYGPFISIGRFEEDNEAVACANAMRMARSVSVWTGDPARAQRLVRALRNDGILVNRHDWLAANGAAGGASIAPRGTLSDFLASPRQ